ncbi:Uncharacterised protein [Raoultella terrigena]|uniref:Uncharacterized protein n=1 Tax=Raoultella terrigena TaxID=577 RepID=A0A485BI97_RAOTE|nr:Uncharacterised protein [Raoultella terrigena]
MLAKARPGDAKWLNLASVLLTLAVSGGARLATLAAGHYCGQGAAGVLSAVTLIAASLWLLQHMKHHNGAPILYSGVGMGIFLSAEFISLAKSHALTSQQIWLICAASAALLFLLVLRLLLSPSDYLVDWKPTVSAQAAGAEGQRGEAWKLLIIYGLAGFGYIITATYLPLFLSGSLTDIDPGAAVGDVWPGGGSVLLCLAPAGA